MKSIQKLHFYVYLILLGLTLVLAIGATAAMISGNIGIISGGLATAVFVIFAILQIGCLAVYQPGLTPYKIGFYLLHVGLLILLAGLAAYSFAGESMTVQVPVSENGQYYDNVQNEEGEMTDLGFAFRLTAFEIQKYESGADKYYKTNVEFADPTTLEIKTDYLEVNRTLRQNGWKLYLMDYSDGTRELMQYGIPDDMIYETYNATGADSGASVLDLVYQDLTGKRYTYYLYDETNGFTYVSAEAVALLSGSLWAYTFEAEDSVAVYLTRKDGSFAETRTETGSQIVSYLKETYPDTHINYFYYTIDYGKLTAVEESYVTEQCTGKVFAGIRDNGDAGIGVYVMKEEWIPTKTFTSLSGGSQLMADIETACGAAAPTVSYMIYSPKAQSYTAATEEAIAQQNGQIAAYAVNMSGSPVIFVHPIQNILLLKRDPGEYATVAGMIMVMLGAVLMCLIRGKAGHAEPSDNGSADAQAVKTQTASKGGKKR